MGDSRPERGAASASGDSDLSKPPSSRAAHGAASPAISASSDSTTPTLPAAVDDPYLARLVSLWPRLKPAAKEEVWLYVTDPLNHDQAADQPVDQEHPLDITPDADHAPQRALGEPVAVHTHFGTEALRTQTSHPGGQS